VKPSGKKNMADFVIRWIPNELTDFVNEFTDFVLTQDKSSLALLLWLFQAFAT